MGFVSAVGAFVAAAPLPSILPLRLGVSSRPTPQPSPESQVVPSQASAVSATGWNVAAAASIVLAAAMGKTEQRRRKRRSGLRSSVTRKAFFNVSGGKKTVIITGASSGLGLAAAKSLVQRGDWFVIMACRDFQKAEKVAKAGEFPKDNYMVMHLDLASNNSVRQFAKAFEASGRNLECLVCNAAVYFPNAHKSGAFFPGLFPGGGPRWSADGHELTFATNYLGHFLLVKLLMDKMKAGSGFGQPARCVILGTVTASVNDKEVGGMIPPKADVGNFQGLEEGMKQPITMVDKGDFNGAKAYKDAKVCDVMLMRELHKRYHASTGVVFTSLYPGCIADTALFREHYPVFQTLFPVLQKSVTNAYVSEQEAGERLAKCVADREYNTSGAYYSWGGASGTGGAGGKEATENTEVTNDRFGKYGSFRTLSVNEIGGDAGNDELCRKLWELSEKLVAE